MFATKHFAFLRTISVTITYYVLPCCFKMRMMYCKVIQRQRLSLPLSTLNARSANNLPFSKNKTLLILTLMLTYFVGIIVICTWIVFILELLIALYQSSPTLSLIMIPEIIIIVKLITTTATSHSRWRHSPPHHSRRRRHPTHRRRRHTHSTYTMYRRRS